MNEIAAVLVFGALASPPAYGQAPAARGGAAPQALQPNPRGPLYQHTGEQYRVYEFPGTGESIPYRLFVPSRWKPGAALPLLVTLRAGQSVDNPYRDPNSLVTEAEKRGYLVVTPMGYRPLRQPYYGSQYRIARPNAPAPADGWTPQENTRAEQDVLNVIDLVTKEYGVDTSRVYLHGPGVPYQLPTYRLAGRFTVPRCIRFQGSRSGASLGSSGLEGSRCTAMTF